MSPYCGEIGGGWGPSNSALQWGTLRLNPVAEGDVDLYLLTCLVVSLIIAVDQRKRRKFVWCCQVAGLKLHSPLSP